MNDNTDRRGLHRHEALAPLSREHHRALAVARTLKRTHRPSRHGTNLAPPEAARRYLAFYQRELCGHFRAEEAVLFPRMAAAGFDLGRLSEEHERIHELTRRIASALERESLETSLLFELGDLVERHVRYEERDAFEYAQRHLDERSLSAIARALEAREAGGCERDGV